MMEQRRVQSFTSSPHQYVVDYAGSHHLSRCDSHEPLTSKPSHGSASLDAFDPWVLVEPPCGSPLSTSSSISHTESVPTPPYTGMAMYNQADSPAYQHIRSLTGHDAWSGEPEPVWRPSYPDMITPIHTNQHPGAPLSCASWGSQEYSLPYQDDPTCNQLHLQPLQGYIPQAGPSAGTTYMPYPASVRYSAVGNVDSASYKQELAKDSENSEMDTDSEPEDSESDDDDSSQQSFHSTSRGSGANSSVMKLGKWSTMPCSFPTASEPRPYVCHLEDKDHPGNPCPKRFVRPEHLRRHVRTVHSAVRNHGCKVCPRHFSRGDNLRDHYWTHLQRGGRNGKNDKMSLPELKAFLGPKEKLLVKRLKAKLHNTQIKQTKSKP
ncbi:hypothetical protein CC77DRAFT_966647 [Alternaria alternata]|uniref:C2H2-type domain-containing protein n=1 Tax=Alternaria alternata TaxID=5599 RepID=A0A177DFD5_ALTAL|nr:hypothetical protein CC77DRAFT_966647 [Alternaria alternata]XP_051592176.1 uncharacterized protein J4E82_001510 [Alternaria postmessia]KAI5379473.1 hypothetical protein J4E82_001510 [Alternaria postmessia]OAG18455.1 hypothetical protein CC77DRAFT_966647 [Alternaria alternata]